MGIPPTGQRVAVPGTGLVQLAKGHRVERWMPCATRSLLQPRGAIPEPRAGVCRRA